MDVSLQLNNPPVADTVNVDLQWQVKVTEPKSGLLPKLFRRHNRVQRNLKLVVTDIHVPGDILCDKNKLFSILYQNNIVSQPNNPVDVTLENMTLPFQLLFHQNEIKDCRKAQNADPRSYDITYKVELRDENNKDIIDSMTDKIIIRLQPMGVKPQFAIDLEEDEIQYSSTLGREEIGTFAAWLNEELMFTPSQLATVKIKLFKGNQDLSHLISFSDGDREAGLRIKRSRSNVKKLPVFIDFSPIANPVDDEETYTIQTEIEIANAFSPEVKQPPLLQQTQFKLKKDQQGTELNVTLRQGSDRPIPLNKQRALPPIEMKFVPRSRLTAQASVIISNIATDNSNPSAGLYVKNLTLSELLTSDVTVVGENNIRLDHFISIDGAHVEAMNSSRGHFIPNGPNAGTEIRLTFNPSGIVDLINSSNYDFQIQSILSFDYWEDRDGKGIFSEDDKKQCRVPVIWKLHLEPNPEWLCVDYGSSAIVCRYANQIIDLKRQKDAIFRMADYGRFRMDNIESNTRFLSSDIVFHAVSDTTQSTLCSQQPLNAATPYLNLSVCLSPTSSLIKNDVRTQLPCLKILVGNEYLPTTPDFMTFRYTRLDENGVLGTVQAKDARLNGEKNCLLRISSIFNEAYASLFRYFILPQSRDKSINKLVLTYPNTYTPVHLKVLEQIARQTFPKVRDGYMKFVSESDAVAAFYLQNWDSYNQGRNINDDETVLVYDMGAGTLDLTLFRKTRNHEGKIEVNILGKIGTGKAGNYLDYLISEIIDDKIPGALRRTGTVSTKPVKDNDTLEERLELKEWVKNNIKPKLQPDATLEYGPHQFPADLILNDSRFTGFLQEITLNIIKRLFASISDPKLKIDTVLMSGRSCRLAPLQNALKDSLRQLRHQGGRILKFTSDGDHEKTVVVEGAMARAGIFSSPESPVLIRSKRLYASYGLIYKRLGGTWHYTELLSSARLPYITDATALEDFEGPNVTAEGTASAGTIKLIQTYLSPEDTEKAYNANDMEFISEMEEYDMADFNGSDTLNVKLRLDYKNNISLYVNGRTSLGNSPQGVSLTSEITKRSIWPVTI